MGARRPRPDVGPGVTSERMTSAAGVGGPSLVDVVRGALAEDLGDRGDVTSNALIPADLHADAKLISRAAGVFAGQAVADEVARQCGIAVMWHAEDASLLGRGTVIAELSGPARSVLAGERTVLNMVGHLSGVATLTRAFVDVCGTCAVLDTRKTTPGLRALEKAAVVAGGGVNHRLGLFDRVLVKDNHLALAGTGLVDAVRQVRRGWPELLVEVEADDMVGVRLALAAGADWILLDNMTAQQMRDAVGEIAGRAHTEGSGRMTIERAAAAAASGVDAISVGALTHSAPTLDIGLDIDL
jgi:nicotinate-nucleotide pyrophosphorylase (carboxylating)